MTERKVNLAIVAYQNQKGQQAYGFRGETIDVNGDDLERFDELNGQYDDPEPVTLDTSEPAGPEPLDHGAGGPEGDFERPESDSDEEPDGLLEEPSQRARLSEWQAYAEQEGVDVNHADGTPKTKSELIDELTED